MSYVYNGDRSYNNLKSFIEEILKLHEPTPAPPEASEAPIPSEKEKEVVADEPEETHKLDMVAEKPAVVAEKPAVVAEKPAVVAEKPAVFAEKPAVVDEKPAVVAEKPAVVQDEEQKHEAIVGEPQIKC